MMAVDRPEFEGMELQPAEIAAMRWQAIEAANTMPGLSPMARRVLIAMICAMDNKTRECFPSELWLAEYLGVNLVSVKKAKAELREARLLHWTNPNGPRHQSHYIFNWLALEQGRANARVLASNAVESRRSKQGQQTRIHRTNGSHMTTLDTSQGSHTATYAVDNSNPKVAVSPLQGSQIAPQGSHLATPKVATPLPEQPLLTDLQEQPCVSRKAATATTSHAAPNKPNAAPGLTAQCHEGRELAAKAPAQRCPYPKLLQAFQGDQATIDAISNMTAEEQAKAAKVLAMKGQAAALAMISPSNGAGNVH